MNPTLRSGGPVALYFLIALLLGSFVQTGCTKKAEPPASTNRPPTTVPPLLPPIEPIVLGDSVLDISRHHIHFGGRVEGRRDHPVQERGFTWYYGTNGPGSRDIPDQQILRGSGDGFFDARIDNLPLHCWVTIMAYAVTADGTYYSMPKQCGLYRPQRFEMSFWLYGTTKDVDNNTYHTVQIGSQTWMVENLRTTRYRNGDSINHDGANPSGRQTSYWQFEREAYLGRCYNGFAVNDNRNIAPVGWHVAAPADYQDLLQTAGGPDIAASILKSTDTSHWIPSGWVDPGIDVFGFSAYPSWYTFNPASPLSIDSGGALFWMYVSGPGPQILRLGSNSKATFISKDPDYFAGVRCVKD